MVVPCESPKAGVFESTECLSRRRNQSYGLPTLIQQKKGGECVSWLRIGSQGELEGTTLAKREDRAPLNLPALAAHFAVLPRVNLLPRFSKPKSTRYPKATILSDRNTY